MFLRNGIRLVSAGLLAMTLGLAPGSSGIPDFGGNTGWINSNPLGVGDLRGKVVLVDFWDYTCVNCLRTLPYLHAWYDRYHNDGFTIVSVHTPEFDFAGEEQNVRAATQRLNVNWPVVLDTKQAIWSRYDNSSWPKEYLFDQSGRLVDTVTGEGHYQETESKIQELLKAGNPNLALPPVMALLPQDSYAKPGAVCYLHTPEVIVVNSKIANAAAQSDPTRETSYVDTTASDARKDGIIYLQGVWQMSKEAMVPKSDAAYLDLEYHAIEVESVLGPVNGSPVRVDVTQDDAPLAKTDAGADIHYDASGMSYVTVDSARAYQLLMNAKMAFHDLRLTPKLPGLGVYSFAFESCAVPAQDIKH
jgi:thiol-disulfide isomerase/thioredoxin